MLLIGLLLVVLGSLIVILRNKERKKGFKGTIQADVSVYGVGYALIIVGLIMILKSF
jgi:hypothetical protein